MKDAAAIDWRDISYLARGNAGQQRAYRALQSLDLFNILRAYAPVLAGTIPLGIDIEGSDLDIICEVDRPHEVGGASDLAAFERAVSDAFAARDGFRIERLAVKGVPTVPARFAFDGLPIEIFAQPRPVTEQNAYRHLLVEARLLAVGREDARRGIRRLKRDGLKTEPAFAHYFKIEGDPYEALLELSLLSDEEMRIRVGH